MENINGDELFLVCEKWACKNDVRLVDNLNVLISDFTADVISKSFTNLKSQLALIKLILLRRNLSTSFEAPIVENCKLLINHVLTHLHSISKGSHKNEQLITSLSLCLDILVLANEDDFCLKFVESHADTLSNADGCEEQFLEMTLHALYVMLCALTFARNVQPLTQGMKTLELFENKSFHKLISDFVFNCSNTTLECYTLFTIIPKLVEATNVYTVVDILWNKISSKPTDAPLSLKLIILCALSELLPFDQAPKMNSELLVLETEMFWEIIQEALTSDDALNRKRGLYLLKRTLDYICVFNLQLDLELMVWNHFQPDSIKHHWEKMLIVLDVLEEKQAHLVTPVAQTILRGNDDNKLIHPSWVLIVFTRLFSHDSLQIVKLGIVSFFNIKVDFYVRCKTYKNVINVLFEKLNNMLLFTTSSCEAVKTVWTEMDSALNDWFKSIPQSLNKAGHEEFYSAIFDSIMKVQWCTLPLFHVLYSMSLVPSVEIIDESRLSSLSDFLKDIIRTQNVFFRGAVQCIILNLLTSSSSPSISSLHAVYILSAFKQNECLHRGLETWERSKNWLKSCSRCDSDVLVNLLLSENGVSIESRARSLVLFVDSGLIVLNSSFNVSLKRYFDVLEDCGTRMYASVEKSDKCLEMILKILEESKSISLTIDSEDDLIKCLAPYIKEAVPYIEKRILYSTDDLTNFDSVELYSKALRVLSDSELTSLEEARDLGEKVAKIVFSSEYHLVKRYLSLKIIQWYIETVMKMASKDSNVPVDCENIRLFCLSMFRDYNMLMNISKNTKDEDLSRHHQRHWGQLLSCYIHTIWSIIQTSLDIKLVEVSNLLDIILADHMLEKAINSIESGGQTSLVPILAAVKYVLPFVEDLDTVLRFLQFSWTSCFELRKVAIFWPAIKGWIEMAFRNEIIIRGGLQKTLLNFAEEMLNEGDSVCGLSNVMFTHLRKELRDVISIKPLLKVLTSALLFGPVLRRDQRIENETYAVIKTLGSSCAVNVLMPNGGRSTSSGEVRVTALAVVLRGGDEVWREVARRLLEHDNVLTAQRRRYHGDSLHHRLRHRILQALLVLESVLADSQTIQAKSCVADLAKWASARLQGDSHQPSVRYQLEWLLVRALIHSPTLLPSFWTIFNQASDERTGSICSFISVAYHLAASVKNVEFIDRCVKEILPWCMAQHFNVRLYAQVVLQKLWLLNEEVASKYDVIRQSLTRSLNQGNAVRNAEKLANDFYFTNFHPLHHFSLECVFYELPRLSNISKDEWVPLEMLEECFSDQDVLVPLANTDDALSQFTTAAWVLKATVEPQADTGMETSGMQKKFVPWKSMFPEFKMAEKPSLSQLIVVASLIDKLPNLGGLARTCEIFTAQCLVVPSLEHTRDKLFETLSMSAEKHINIVEVKPHDLPQYLRDKKASGYTIVGAEQTAASVSLDTYKFPKQCLLLLGNEKEGIPVNLLPLLDTCVEVPQLGVVRSLNVHVTGALFVWEYTKQFVYS